MPEERKQQQWWESLPLPEVDTEELEDTSERIRRTRPAPEGGPELDTSDLHTPDPDDWTYGRPEPAWVIHGDHSTEDLGEVKSGKEGTVTLQRWTRGDRSHLVAVKSFRPRAQRAFRREESYRDGYDYPDARVTRAVKGRTRFGRSVLEYEWAYREYPMMRLAWDAGVHVPYPIKTTPDGLAMEFVGDEEQAAPRLVDVRLAPDEAWAALEMVINDVRRLLDRYLVHGDLSAYNILWWQDRTWIIDFPQTMDIAKSSMGVDALKRDIANVCRYFRRMGADADPGEIFRDVMSSSPVAWR